MSSSIHDDNKSLNPLFKRIRLLRKKLKQIEVLKLLPRKLNEEEVTKIERQDEFREELLDLLAQQHVGDQKDLENSNDMSAELCNHSDGEEVQDISAQVQTKLVHERKINIIQGSNQPIASDREEANTKKVNLTAAGKSQSKSSTATGTGESKAPDVSSADSLQAIRRTWANKYFELTELSGHTDIVLSVDINGKYIVSGSRDTSVKLWDTASGELMQNFGGHTGSVQCVKLVEALNPRHTSMETMVVSGSHDCSIRFWDVSTGVQIKEFYAYNSVLCMELVSDGRYLVAGLEGGKLEVYDLHTGALAYLSHSLEAEAINCMSCEGNLLAVGSADGLIMLLELKERAMRCLYILDDNLGNSVKSIALSADHIIVGDDEANVKVIRWKTNTVTSIANHHSEFGVTDDLCKHGSYLLSSAYDYDAGVGYINVRKVGGGKYNYMSSITNSDVMHILSLAVMSSEKGQNSPMSIVSGGIQLVLWREDTNRSSDSVKCSARKLVLADDQIDSDSDECDLGDSSESEDIDSDLEETETGGWWCNIL